jgi:hypothetical protein
MARGPLVAWSAGTPPRLVVECWPELVLVSGCRLPLPRPLHSALPGVRLLVLVRFLPKLLSQCRYLPLGMANSRARVMLARTAGPLLDVANARRIRPVPGVATFVTARADGPARQSTPSTGRSESTRCGGRRGALPLISRSTARSSATRETPTCRAMHCVRIPVIVIGHSSRR